jgi:hypothetical protein
MGFVERYLKDKTEAQRNKLLLADVKAFRAHDGPTDRVLALMDEKDPGAEKLKQTDPTYFRAKKDEYRPAWSSVVPERDMPKKVADQKRAKLDWAAAAHNTMAADTLIVLEVGKKKETNSYLIYAWLKKPNPKPPTTELPSRPSWDDLLQQPALREKWIKIVPFDNDLHQVHEPMDRLDPPFDASAYQREEHFTRTRTLQQSMGIKPWRVLPQLDIRQAVRYAGIKKDGSLPAAAAAEPMKDETAATAAAEEGEKDEEANTATPTSLTSSTSAAAGYATLVSEVDLQLKTMYGITVIDKDCLKEPTLPPEAWKTGLPLDGYIPWVLPQDGRITSMRFELQEGLWRSALHAFFSAEPLIEALIAQLDVDNTVLDHNQEWLVEMANLIMGAPDRIAAQIMSDCLGGQQLCLRPETVESAVQDCVLSKSWSEEWKQLSRLLLLATALARCWDKAISRKKLASSK